MIVPGAGSNAVPVLSLQEALVIGLQTLRSDQRAIEELIGRQDSLRHNTANEWRRALTAAMLEMLDPSSDQFAEVLIGYPTPPGKARLPAISLVVDSGGENPAEAVAGNILRVSSEFHGPDQEAWETTEIGAGQRTTVQIGAWSPAPERGILLTAAVKWCLYFAQDLLKQRGIHEVSYTEGGVQVPPELEPRVAYCPMVSATMLWTFRETVRRKVPNRVSLRRMTVST
jgi:hypothetical protein